MIRPGPVTVVERVAHASAEAQRETFDRLAHEFTDAHCAALDGLLVTRPGGPRRRRSLTLRCPTLTCSATRPGAEIRRAAVYLLIRRT